MSGIPGSNKSVSGQPGKLYFKIKFNFSIILGPFVDKDPDRGIKATSANNPLMMGAYAAGGKSFSNIQVIFEFGLGLGIAYMLLKVLKKK